MKSIGIEICYSKSGGQRYNEAEENSVELTAYLLHKYSLPVSAVKQHYHWSGKNCPHRIRANSTWIKFLQRVEVALAKLKAPAKPVKPSAPTSKALYRIKSGSFNTRREAENARTKLAQNKLANEKYVTIHEANGKFYFQTGTYADKLTAERYLQRMKDLKIIWVGNLVQV